MSKIFSQAKIDRILAETFAAQLSNGAFPSTVCFGERTVADANGFVTALVLRELNRISKNVPREIVVRALDFLESCASVSVAGAFNFYPQNSQPQWINRLPDDADDTAVIALELLRGKRLNRTNLIKKTCVALDKFRLQRVGSLAPPWLQRGVFLTWLSAENRLNTVDCAVNANIAALLATLNLKHWRGYSETCAMIEAGIRWAGNSPPKARALTPFYPHPAELKRSVQHAVDCGAAELQMSLQLLEQPGWTQSQTIIEEQTVFSSAYGLIVWRSPVLQKLRLLKDNLKIDS